MNNRRELIIMLGAGALALPLRSFAQAKTTKIPRLGYLTNDSAAIDLPRRQVFQRGLKELGYVEGENIAIEYRTAAGNSDKLREFAAELHRLNVDLMFAFSLVAVDAARKEMPTAPIVSITPDPLAAGLAKSYARPGGYITGLSSSGGEEIYGKYMQLLKEVVPSLTRVAALTNPTNRFMSIALKGAEERARRLKLTLTTLEADNPGAFEKAFVAARKERVGGLLVIADAMFLANRKMLADLAAKYRLPAIYPILEHVEAGGLMSYAASRLEMFHRAAFYVDRILKGTKPGDLPVEQPTKYELVINGRTAKELGLKIPQSLLTMADRIIE